MLNTQQQQDDCPNGFYYDKFGKGFLVHAATAKSLQTSFLGVEQKHDKVFSSLLGEQEVEKLCTGQTSCKPATCEYKQELFRALRATDSSIDPKQHFKK